MTKMEFTLLSDHDIIARAVVWDDQNNEGENHQHDSLRWNELRVVPIEDGRHFHRPGEGQVVFPFIATSNVIPKWMFATIFEEGIRLSDEIGREGMIIMEIGAGANGHARESEFGMVDFSYQTLAERFKDGTYPIELLERVVACIHIDVPLEIREDRLARRGDITLESFNLFRMDDSKYLSEVMEEVNPGAWMELSNACDLEPERFSVELNRTLDEVGFWSTLPNRYRR